MQWLLRKNPILLGYMAINFTLIGVDVTLAHSQNNFFRFEMIPLIYTPFAIVGVLLKLFWPDNRWAHRYFLISMGLGVAIGLIGTFFHLAGNATSDFQPIHRLIIEGSPVAAPIAFAGIALYTLVVAKPESARRNNQLLILVGLGFLASVLAAFLDHARLSFSPIYTLFPLLSGLMATIACFWLAYSQKTKSEVIFFLSIMVLNLFIGLLGFVFHVFGDLAGTQTIVWARFLYRNPLLGPLLFCDVAVLGGLSLLPEQIGQSKNQAIQKDVTVTI
ncbi:hypothetical protein [Desulfosporosinus hippei]|uniref:Uncharacterized protein n=1 Tax=Desulfosporosinus hippei DSM 8344 TaxID=1121419 RepID=A0A1G8H018_9FIRM|nr:hypothetical protein [Desulfosporosinus hippei]SDH99967.1 hypothetical protein SAMN05443529_1244 [Desulfosporosinus hippei DSM 8344]